MAPPGPWLSVLSERLRGLSETPELDSSVVLAAVTGRARSWVLAHPELELTRRQKQHLDVAMHRLEQGEPLPYVLAEWEFFGLRLLVSKDVLIPRPETECLVERALDWLRTTPGAKTAADIGTGSGCIAVALAVYVPGLALLATDISKAALQIARQNARRHHVEDRIRFVECDLLPPGRRELPNASGWPPFDLLCANLPYIPSAQLRGLAVFEREPTIALDGGEDGLEPLRRLLGAAPAWLAPGGRVLLEVEADHGAVAAAIARAAFPNSEVGLTKDLAGRDRVLEIQTRD